MTPHRRRRVVRHTHSSSRFDRSPRSLLRAVRWYVQLDDIVTLTEVGDRDRAAVLDRVAGFEFRRGAGGAGASESGIGWRARRWSPVWHDTALLVDDAAGPRASVWAHTEVLDDDGTLLLISVLHLPSDVQDNYRDPNTSDPKVRDHRQAVGAWLEHVAAVLERFPDSEVLLVADFNLDYRLPWVREWADRTFSKADLTVTWQGRLPKRGGTHGRSRIIDWSVTTMRVLRIRLRRDDRSSDHRSYREVLRVRRHAGR